MEGDVGAQVAPAVFLRQSLPGRLHDAPPMGKKRDLPWQQNPRFCHPQHHQNPRIGPGIPIPNSNWNPKSYGWDSVGFVAKPLPVSRDSFSLGTSAVTVEVEQRKKGEESLKAPAKGSEEDGENLTLKLGGGAYSAEDLARRPSKRVRSRSPGSGGGGGGGSYPMCQVDDCRADLSGAKDYHRRHKVCEPHSKTTQALVGKLMQRFCQQCSRFHPLSAFDEGKRSCRRRLAGHNRRRRKTQPEDVSSRSSLPENQDNGGNGKMDLLIAILENLQGKSVDKATSIRSISNRDHLIQLFSKINSLDTSNSSSRSPLSCDFDLNVSQASQQSSFEQPSKPNGNATNLLAAISSAVAASAPGTVASLLQGSSDSNGDDKTKIPFLETSVDVNSRNKSTQFLPLHGVGSSSCTNHSPLGVSERPVQEARIRFPLQLFAEDGSPSKLGSSMKYLSSESSNPMEDRSPPSSPPVAQELFPVHSATERNYERILNIREDNTTVEASTSCPWSTPLELYKESNRGVENGAIQNLRYQPGYASSSGSDNSHSSSNSDAQDRTGRIMFKLFDKDPSSLPGTLRTQIHNWLSNSPSNMESYIRPGCVVLSVYVSMPSIAWDELEEELLQRVTSLVQFSDIDFWRNGRFLVRTGRQLASHKNGKIRLCKSWKTWSAPELTSVSPVAVVSGQETSLVLRGCNLTVPGTKIHCTYMGGYTSKEVLGSTYPGTIYDDSCSESFSFPGGTPDVFGRCFIEVENGFKGNSFPLIIADAAICQELRALESEFVEDMGTTDVIPEDHVQNNVRPRSREDILHFLNELGWLFQKSSTPSSPLAVDFSITRYKFLFTFSVDRDWFALIETLLDLAAKRSLTSDVVSREALEMLSEVQLLNRAVKRRCRKMVDLLIRYSIWRGPPDASKVYLFTPNLAGPGGVTPLHLAASTPDAEDMVDALTDDPQELGLNCWNSILDDNGQSPSMYASMRGNDSYNKLISRKLADRKSNQVSITVEIEDISADKQWKMREPDKPSNRSSLAVSCALCAVMEVRRVRQPAHTRGLLRRPYVHSMLAIAAVCVCVCLIIRGMPKVNSIMHFKWENLEFGPC